MSNAIIDKQRETLANLANLDGLNPDPGEGGAAGAGAPPAAPPQGVPGQEPPAGAGDGAANPTAPLSDPPQPQLGTAEVEALRAANADLTRQVQEFKSLYERQRGMVAPLQRKTAEQDREIADLRAQVEDLKSTAAASGSPSPAHVATNPATTAGADDPRLKEFMDLYGEMIPGLELFIQSRTGALLQPQFDQVKPAIDLAKKAERDALLANHLAPLYARYPNAGAIIRSPEFAKWVEQQPDYINESIVDKVTAPENHPVAQVISIFDDFTRATSAPPPPAPQAPAPSPGEMAVDVRRVPTSATPGGTPLPQPLSRERLTQLNRALTVDRSLYNDAEIAAFKAELAQGEAASNAAGYGLAPRLDTLTQR